MDLLKILCWLGLLFAASLVKFINLYEVDPCLVSNCEQFKRSRWYKIINLLARIAIFIGSIMTIWSIRFESVSGSPKLIMGKTVIGVFPYVSGLIILLLADKKYGRRWVMEHARRKF